MAKIFIVTHLDNLNALNLHETEEFSVQNFVEIDGAMPEMAEILTDGTILYEKGDVERMPELSGQSRGAQKAILASAYRPELIRQLKEAARQHTWERIKKDLPHQVKDCFVRPPMDKQRVA
jgi:hypothetical protein